MLELISPDWSDLPDVEVFCSTRLGGGSRPPYAGFNLAQHVGDNIEVVEENRALLRAMLPGKPDLQWLNQVHGQMIVPIQDSGDPITADGLVTTAQGIACCVQTADCLPVVLVSERQSEVAAVHAGWRGLAAGILEQAISKMKTPASDLRAWLGPAIGPCHFEVGEEVREAFLASPLVGVDECFVATSAPGKYMADLQQLARLRLAAAGVPRVDSSNRCSYCETELFYSYRRDQLTGRNVTGVYLRN